MADEHENLLEYNSDRKVYLIVTNTVYFMIPYDSPLGSTYCD